MENEESKSSKEGEEVHKANSSREVQGGSCAHR
jgi:hypothetical protein